MKRQPASQRTTIAAVIGGALFLCACLALALIVVNWPSGTDQPTEQPERASRDATLTLAYSPEKAELIKQLADRFNAQKLRTDGQAMQLKLVELSPEEMVNQALSGEAAFQALTPDSSLWLDQLNRRWVATQSQGQEAGVIAPRLTSDGVRYAISPIVIAAWEEDARSLGWPGSPVGWATLQTRAQQDAGFRWSHPSTAYASGLLATLAEFYAGAGVQRGLTVAMAQDQKTVDFVSAVEKTVKFYGEAELAIMQRVATDPNLLDAFVVSEQLVVAFNTGRFGSHTERLVALYPAEGTLWADHPLALLETAAVTTNQRATFQAFREFLASAESQTLILQSGYRPADLKVPLNGPGSPFTAANGVDPAEPQTTLQLPSADVVQVVQNVWALTKRKTNVMLVVDTSGSMQGDKLDNARTALRTFLAAIPNDQERVGMIEFNTDIANIIELDTLATNRAVLVGAVDRLQANGNTALLDGVRTAYQRLQRQADPERINAIVAMTDGRENASLVSLNRLVAEIRQGNEDVPVIIFCIAYGSDADLNMLQALADASGGQVREGDLETIRELYKILSSYF